MTHDSNGYVTLTSVNSGKVLDVNGGVSANGTNVQQYDSNGTYAQKWIAVKNSDGSYTFQSALAENKVLDVSGCFYLEWCQRATVYRKWHECSKVGEIADRLTNRIWLRTSIFLLSAISGCCRYFWRRIMAN